MRNYINIEKDLIKVKKSFPNCLISDMNSLFSEIKIYSKHNANYGYNLRLENEVIEIPIRIYWEEYRLLEPTSLSSIQRQIVACIMTRHSNGYIREKYLKQILASDQYWVMPYIIQLMGEYVVEILELIWKNFDSINIKSLLKFINNNDVFWEKTKQRIYSYWDCYHRYTGRSKIEYVGFQLIKKIENLRQ